jgi:hypothetical protein
VYKSKAEKEEGRDGREHILAKGQRAKAKNNVDRSDTTEERNQQQGLNRRKTLRSKHWLFRGAL